MKIQRTFTRKTAAEHRYAPCAVYGFAVLHATDRSGAVQVRFAIDEPLAESETNTLGVRVQMSAREAVALANDLLAWAKHAEPFR